MEQINLGPTQAQLKKIDDEKIPKNFKSVIADELIKKITKRFNFFND